MLFYNAWTLARHLIRRVGGSVTMMMLKIFSRYLVGQTLQSVRWTDQPDPG